MQSKTVFAVGTSFVLLAGATVAGAVALTTGNDASKPQQTPINYAPVDARPGTVVAPAAALDAALSRAHAAAVSSARIGEPPGAVQRRDPTRSRMPWLYATVRITAMRDGLDIEPMWEADLIEGAVAERSGSNANVRDNLGGATFDAILADGTLVKDASNGLGDIATRQQFSSAADGDVAQSISQRLAAVQLMPLSIRIVRAMGPAPAVIVATSTPEQTMRDLVPVIRDVFGSPPKYEGYYLEVRTESGIPLARLSASFRTGAGRSWIAPPWRDVTGVKTLGHNDASGFHR